MKVIKTNIKAETVEINPREAEALRNTFQDNRRTYNDNIRKYAKQSNIVMRTLITAVIKETVGTGRSCVP